MRPARSAVRQSLFSKKLDHVLKAGARVFAREGYGRATIRQVAGEAKMSLAGLYYYVASKEELLFLLQFHAFDSIIRGLTGKLKGVRDPRQRLRLLVANHLEHFLDRMDELKVCAHEMESLAGKFYSQVQALRRSYFKMALQIVQTLGTRQGHSKIGARPATLHLFGMLNWIYMWYPAERGVSADMLADQLVGLFLDGYLPRESRRPRAKKAREADV